MISRRGLIGALLAAPVVIRTPGLLMRVKPLMVSDGVALTSIGHPINVLSYVDTLAQWEEARAGLPRLLGATVFDVSDADFEASEHRQRLLREIHRQEAEMAAAFDAEAERERERIRAAAPSRWT